MGGVTGYAPPVGYFGLATRYHAVCGRVHLGKGQDSRADQVRSARERGPGGHETDRDDAAVGRKTGETRSEVTVIRGDVMKTIVIATGALLAGILWPTRCGFPARPARWNLNGPSKMWSRIVGAAIQ